MEKYLENIVESYQKRLNSEVGEGQLTNRLIEKLKGVFKANLNEYILKNYEKELSEELGAGNLKRRVINLLKETLGGDNLSETLIKTDSKKEFYLYLDKEINWENLGVRTHNCLKYACKIETYNDLIEYCYRNSKKIPFSSEQPYLDRVLLLIRNFGKESLAELKNHLSSINFDFSEEFAKNIVEEKISQEDFLNKSIDYNALPKYKTRVKNVLKPVIETYRELQEKCYKNFADKNGGNRSWHGEREYSFFLGEYRYLGKKSIEEIISHLKQINFDFSEESAKKTFEKSNK